jgi:cell division protease FtsH
MAKQVNNQNDVPRGNKPKSSRILYIVYGVIMLVLLFGMFDGGSSKQPITWERLEKILERGDYESITVVNQSVAQIKIKDEALKTNGEYGDLRGKKGLLGGESPVGVYTYNVGTLEHFDHQLEGFKERHDGKIVSYENETESNALKDILVFFGPLLVFIIFIWLMGAWGRKKMGGEGGGGFGGFFGFGRSTAKQYDATKQVNVSFKDVAGLAGAKEEVMEVVDFLKNPKHYTELGGKIPKGVLLVGPPGTGKTLLAKAVAGEAGVPFFSMSGSDFVEMFVGVGASRVRGLFDEAKKKSPCIVFIDEIDAVGRARGRGGLAGSNDERENTLNQLLTEMDGFSSTTNVIVLAATNRADVLDKALMRAGRFDRQIYVELPDIEERKAIFAVHMKNLKINVDKSSEGFVDRDFLAKQTPGFSGADIANVCNEAALVAARRNKKQIEKQDFLDAVDRIVGGLEKRTKVLSDQEKHTIAYHESGHASVSWLLRWANPLVKVTIVPRGKALGAAWYLPEERQITTYEQMFDEMTSLMAGRASEEIVYGRISTGALNDIERATKMAQALVTYYGMSPEVGNISFYDSTGQSEYAFAKPFSEKTAEAIDREVRRIVEEAYGKAKELLLSHREQLDQLAAQLYEKEVLFREDLERIYGPRPWETPETPEIPETSETPETPETPDASGKTETPETPEGGEE